MSTKKYQNVVIWTTFIFMFHCVQGSLILSENQLPFVNFSTHDVAFELSGSGSFNVCVSENPVENLTVAILLDYADVVQINPHVVVFTPFDVSLCKRINLTGDKNAGHLSAYVPDNVTGYDVSQAYCRVAVNVHDYLDVLDDVLGWIYFVAWIVSFYPQIWINFRRRSVVGLNLDFVSLNILGFFCYSMYNCGLYYIPEIKDEYMSRHVHGVMPVQKQDIAFALLAFISTLITGSQAILYERGGQKVSKPAVGIIGLALVFLLISLSLSLANVISWLDYLYYFSYVKLAITLIKYIPQAWFNFRRKSTKGWSIGNIILDFTGGSFSMLQMFIDAFNYDDWSSLFGDFTKFALGLISILFDVVFLIQHYILYRNNRPIYESIAENSSPSADYVRNASTYNTENETGRKFEQPGEVVLFLTCDCNFVKISHWSLTFDSQTSNCQEIIVHGINPGQAVLRAFNSTANDSDLQNAFIRVSVYRHDYLIVLSNVVGWIYFIAWTTNFFPQMRTNCKRKSVQGLNLDFLALNILGFFSYSLFNCGLYFIPQVRAEYFKFNPYGVMPVQIQDIAFALLAFACSVLVGLQAIVYDRGSQKVSKICLGLLSLAFAFLVVTLIMSCLDVISWLTYLYNFSYIKLGVTIVKYIPQVILNYGRKSTIGYNIVVVLMDVVGGAFSFIQMFIISYNYDDWSSLSGNRTKLLLSIVSLVFDFIFIFQHYVLYRTREGDTQYKVLSNTIEPGQEVVIN